MNWIDVAGAPGSGKSTLCDPLWGPHDIEIKNILPPYGWHDFLNEITRLLTIVRHHRSFIPAVRMNRRSVRKMATVASIDQPDTYIQTGFVQRGLGFGWRLKDMGISLDELRPFFRLMPVSLGVVFTECDPDVVVARNHEREKHARTAHENRDFMVPLMLPAINVAKDCLVDRGISILAIDTEQDAAASRDELISWALDRSDSIAGDGSASGPRTETPVLSPPIWW